MDNLRRMGDSISIPIQPDSEGFTGRECPNPECERYFKIQCGTGLVGKSLPCHCPYCGHTGDQNQFWTKEQIRYAESVALRTVSDAFYKDLKGLEFDYKPSGPFGIGFSMKVSRGAPEPIRHYAEKKLETEVVCSNCTLRYCIYGVFAFCPDCGQHNSLQILDKNLEVVEKMLALAAGTERQFADRLTENALEDCVSAFDGFGREVCRLHKNMSSDPGRAQGVRFQDIEGAKRAIIACFNVDISSPMSTDEWRAIIRAFQKRHVIAHKMGVIDEEYIKKSGDASATVGRKIVVSAEEVRALSSVVRRIAQWFLSTLAAKDLGQLTSGGEDPIVPPNRDR